jgi:hypothetical protein
VLGYKLLGETVQKPQVMTLLWLGFEVSA